MSAKYRFQFYKELHKSMPAIYAEAKKFADDIGITPDMKGKIGLTGAVSSCHALLTREVSKAIEDASRKVIENKFLIEEIREIVKDVARVRAEAEIPGAAYVDRDAHHPAPFTARVPSTGECKAGSARRTRRPRSGRGARFRRRRDA